METSNADRVIRSGKGPAVCPGSQRARGRPLAAAEDLRGEPGAGGEQGESGGRGHGGTEEPEVMEVSERVEHTVRSTQDDHQ